MGSCIQSELFSVDAAKRLQDPQQGISSFPGSVQTSQRRGTSIFEQTEKHGRPQFRRDQDTSEGKEDQA